MQGSRYTERPVDGLTLPLDYSAIERILPHRYPFALVDRVIEHEPEGRSEQISKIRGNDPSQAAKAMVVAVMSNGSVESQHLEFDGEVSEARLGAATVHLQRGIVGRSLVDLGDISPTGEAGVDAVCAKAVAALRGANADNPVDVGGASSMASAFDAVDVVRQVLQTLEQQYLVVSLVRDILNRGLSVAIGAEHGVEPLANCSVVVAPVVVDGQQMGTVGVLGPTRMDYPQALATVEVVSDRLGRRLGEG